MIDVQNYLQKTDTFLNNKKYTLFGDFYYIDTDIWFQGELQPPRVLNFKTIDVANNKCLFFDDDSNAYEVSIEDVYDNKLDLDNRMKIEIQIYENREV